MDGIEAYLGVRDMIGMLVDRAALRGGDRDELMGEANLAFVQAWRSWDPGKGSLTTWVWWQIRGRFLRMEQFRGTTGIQRDLEDDRDPFWLVDLLDGLSLDARDMVRLVLDSPEDMVRLVRGGRLRSGKIGIQKYLQGLGWTARRVKESFEEIGRALG